MNIENEMGSKVAFITYSLSGGGTEKRLINLAQYFFDKKISVDIISLKRINDYKDEFKSTFKKVEIIYLSEDKKSISKLILPFTYLSVLIKLISLMRIKKYQILFGFDYYSWCASFMISILFHIKYVVVIGIVLSYQIKHDFGSFFEKINRNFIKILVKKANAIICISEGIKYDLKRFFYIQNNKIIVIHNGVDLKKAISQTVGHNQVLNEKIILTSCGRLVEEKGHRYLIDAFSYISKIYPNVFLYILGQGPLKDQLENQIANLNLQKKVFLPGFTKSPNKYFKMSDIFILPSLYEGFGNVILEAMSCGLPIISTDCPYGPREILTGEIQTYPLAPIKRVTQCKYGILIPSLITDHRELFDNSHLIEAILLFIENKSLCYKYKKTSLERARFFSLDHMGNRYYSVFKRLLNVR
ncbi:MAG: glycosyltransferase [Candidatus Roizmanbacteria bacterium]|nr:glycosyltransferase [Candidatus Roizmanbacteria bacterium]